MSESLVLYSFADVDRSGKVRWLAAELGIDVVEERVGYGAHRAEPYIGLNPLGQIPTVQFRGDVLTESTAICHTLAEAWAEPRLSVTPGAPERRQFLYWLAVFGETLEARLVECSVSRAGILGPEYFALHERGLRRKLAVVAEQLPESGWLCGEAFTLADIVAGYNLRLAVQCDLVSEAALNPYLSRLRARPAARASRIFDSLTS